MWVRITKIDLRWHLPRSPLKDSNYIAHMSGQIVRHCLSTTAIQAPQDASGSHKTIADVATLNGTRGIYFTHLNGN